MQNILIIINAPPYGSERCLSALRLVIHRAVARSSALRGNRLGRHGLLHLRHAHEHLLLLDAFGGRQDGIGIRETHLFFAER